MIGFGFLLHAGLLAGLYNQPSPFLLPPSTGFALIPVGYLSLLLLAVLLVWLMRRLKLIGWRAGLIFGLGLGGLTWGSFNLGLLSSSIASFSLLLGWFVGQTLDMAIAGAVIGSGIAGIRLGRLFGIVMVFVLLAVIATIVLHLWEWFPQHAHHERRPRLGAADSALHGANGASYTSLGGENPFYE
jgi:hypothetical protein